MGIDFTVFKGSPDGIVQATHHLDLPTGNEVLIKITHSGICGTDEHYRHSDLVLGHEGVGIIQEVGPDVKEFKIGEAVGSCRVFAEFPTGEDQYCRYREYYGVHNFHQGSFGSHAIWDASFVFHIPDGLALESAAPLMCGGASVFNVLETHNIRSTDRVGVVGIGGLGHLAVIFLAKMGASVVVFSSTESKREEAMKLGATEFYTTSGVEELAIGKPLDHLLVTTNSLPNEDLNQILGRHQAERVHLSHDCQLREPRYTVVPSPGERLHHPRSAVAARSVHKRMLEFAARHGVNPIIERFPMTKTGVEEGMAKLREGKMRYRGVLVA